MESKDNSQKKDDNNDPQKAKEKSRRMILYQRLLFIPIISIKVIASYIFYELYLSYAAYNKIDTPYMQLTACFIVSLFFYTYYLVVMTPATQENVDKYFQFQKEVNSVKENLFTFCEFCKKKKYLRTSHCRFCSECILYRDHHCPYTANCVGFNNIQYFLNFLFWGIYLIGFYNLTCIKFYFKKDNINLNDGSVMPKYIKRLIIVDFIINILFFNGILYLFLRTVYNIYDNFTNREKRRFFNVESNNLCYKNKNEKKLKNVWDIGFLASLYYGIGPTPLHLIFPILKFKNYTLDVNCPLLRKGMLPDRLQNLQFIVRDKKKDIATILEESGSNPDEFIKLSHHYYPDANKII